MSVQIALIDALNELLEAERAGARVAMETARQAPESLRPLIEQIQHDESHWCAVLLKSIRSCHGEASLQTGAFHEKAMAIADVGERLAFLNRGQRWVVRRLEALLPQLDEPELQADLTRMLEGHKSNIDKVSRLSDGANP